MTNQKLDTENCYAAYCSRKGVFCAMLTDHSKCNSTNCLMDIPDVESVKTNTELIEELVAEAPKCINTVGELIAEQPAIYPLYTQAYVDELKKEVAEYKSLYEDQYRKCSELQAKDLNKKYAEAIASDYLKKNAELVKQNEGLSQLVMAYHSQTIKPVTVETIYEFLKDTAITSADAVELYYANELLVPWERIARYFKEKFSVGDFPEVFDEEVYDD